MEEGREGESWAGYVDWRNRPAKRGRHGGMRAASFVLVVEVMQSLAIVANASNLVRYLSGFMHMSPARSATTVTNFMGTAFILALLGGFLSDAFFTTFVVYLLSAFIHFLGLTLLTIQARSPHLKPPPCSSTTDACREPNSSEASMLFIGLYLVALGAGGVRGTLPSHGAEQLDQTTPEGRKQRSTFFNYFVFCLSAGALIAVTFVVWLEDNKGWQWGYGVSTISVLLSIPVFLAGSGYYRNKIPTGSPLTVIAKVVAARILLRSNKSICNIDASPEAPLEKTMEVTQRSRHPYLVCTASEIEDTKSVFSIIPIFLSTIILNCCLAQLITFSVQQAATMNTSIHHFTVPPASLPMFPVLFIIILAPLYDHVLIPLARKATGTEMGISHLQRIGTGLAISIVAMAVAALVEIKRRRVAMEHASIGAHSPLPISMFWVALQFLFLGSADLFTLAGMLEFFFSEAPARMRSLATSLSWASLSMGYYLSSVLVEIVNSATRRGGHRAWLGGSDLNQYRLDLFYWLLCILSALNFLVYLFWACRYKYKSLGV